MRCRLPHPALLQLGLVAIFLMWCVVDPQFESLLRHLSASNASLTDTVAHVGWSRLVGFAVLIGIAVTGMIWFGSQLLSRSQRSRNVRSLKSLIWMTSIVAVWCGLAVNHPAIAWQAERLRLLRQVDRFESIAQPLRDDWPSRDGEVAPLGSFMAYPFGRPTTLILLQSPAVSTQGVFVSAVQRGESGAIKLQLSGVHEGDWAEWHPRTSRPKSFTGGLSEEYRLDASLSLGNGWYLVRYNT